MSNEIAFILSPTATTVIIDGEPRTVEKSAHVTAELREVLAIPEDQRTEQDIERLKYLISPGAQSVVSIDGAGVEIVNGTQVTFKGRRIPEPLERYVLELHAEGLPLDPVKKFIQRIYLNPSVTARDELILFLQTQDLPISPDGCFYAYKRVTADYKDGYTKTLDNSIGQTVTMPRQEVDPDRDRTCSRGLHFCSRAYLSAGIGGTRIVLVKVDPTDVVAIPSDYKNAKGRTWRYTVVGEIDAADFRDHSFDATVMEIVPDDVEIEVSPELDDDWTEIVIPDEHLGEAPAGVEPDVLGRDDAFQAPAPERKGFWRKAKDIVGI